VSPPVPLTPPPPWFVRYFDLIAVIVGTCVILLAYVLNHIYG